MAPATRVDKTENNQPDVLPADFAAWDDTPSAPAVLPDNFSGFDEAAHVPHKKDETPRAVRGEAIPPKFDPVTVASIRDSRPSVPAGIRPSGQWKSNIHTRGAVEQIRPVVLPDPETSVEDEAKDDEPVITAIDDFPKENKWRVPVICAAAVLLISGVITGVAMHSRNASVHTPMNTTAVQVPAQSATTAPVAPETPVTSQPDTNASGTSPDTGKNASTQSTKETAAQSATMAKQDAHINTPAPINTTARIAPVLSRSNEKEPSEQINMAVNNNYGNPFNHNSRPSVQLAIPSQANVPMAESLQMAVTRPDPQYPQIARNMHMEGTVDVRIVVSKAGEVRSASIISGPGLFHAAALEAVKRWRYRPYKINNQPVEMITAVRFGFHAH